ncbi:MAG: NBR1-Ig-like domain-containing protein [Bellilinea sp.]
MLGNRKLVGVTLLAVLLLTTLAACSKADATPTNSPEMVYTQAAQTVAAGLTQTAVLMPTATSTPTLQPSNTPAPTQAATATLSVSVTPLVQKSATSATGPDKAEWVAQNPGDDTILTAGQDFTLVWTVRNTGTTTWTTDYQLRYYLVEQSLRMGAGDLKLSKEVKPNESIDLSLAMKAPANSGEYTTIWVLTNKEGVNFYPLTFRFKVGAAGATATATVAPTAGATATP